MKRLETLQKEGRKFLDDNQYKDTLANGVSAMDIARAMDRLREAEQTLRRAFDSATKREP